MKQKGTDGNVCQAHQRGKWDPRSAAYGRFWIYVPEGEAAKDGLARSVRHTMGRAPAIA